MATILIVDDVPGDRTVIATLLRQHGHRVLEAANGLDALEVARNDRPDLVITDMLMPVMDGSELVSRLRLDPVTADIPVVCHTASYGAADAKALALAVSIAGILIKPADPQDVLTIVERALSGDGAPEHPSDASPTLTAFDREHLRLLTNELSDKACDLRAANARLRALINIGLELASERDTDRLLRNVTIAVRDLFGATYVTLGIVDLASRTVRQVVGCGVDSAWLGAGDLIPGILETVVTGRRTMRGANPGGAPSALQLPLQHPEIEAFVVAPIASPSHVYGWICLVANGGRPFSEEDESLITALSGQVGRIHENGHFRAVAEQRAAQLEQEIVERARAEDDCRTRAHLSALGAAVGLSLTVADSLGHALQQCAEALVSRLGASFARIWTVDASGHVLELQASAGLYTHLNGRHARVPFGQLKIGRIARDRRPYVTNAVIGDRQVDDQEWALREGIVSFAGHPLIVDDRVVGVMAIFGRQALSVAVLEALESVADHIALGIERHQGADALRATEERMRFALNAAGIGIWDLDFATGTLWWSETIEAHYGLKSGTFGGTFDAFVECIHSDDRDLVRRTFQNAEASGADFLLPHRAVWPDGTIRWQSGAGRIRLGPSGQPLRGLGISMDVTTRRTLELQYQQAQKMEAVGHLAGGVAHDFNNLLTAILGYCELLLSDTAKDDRRRGDIVEIANAGYRAAGLTRQLLAFSRRQIIEPSLVDLNATVEGIQSMIGRLIGEDVAVVLCLHPTLPIVRVDRGQVEQVILNLAVNARDAMPGGGTLTFETDVLDLDAGYAATHVGVTPGPHVALIVTDTGTGMTPEIQARLFEPFFTTKELGKGTGLGLATVEGIVTQSGGSISVCSEPDRGTSFTVFFPIAQGAEIAVETPPDSTRPTVGSQTVLVVEDASGVRELTRRLLQREGYKVLVAADAAEGFRVFEQHPTSIDVVLTDVVMPGGSGPELARRLAERRPALRVIYMSGYTEDAIARHGVLEPGIDFLQKPFTSETLGRKVREVLGR